MDEVASRDLDALIALLQNESEATRVHAIRALGMIEDSRAAEALVNTVLTEWDHEVQFAAVAALQGIHREYAIQSFITALNNTNPAVRSASACALGRMGAKRAVDSLLTALGDPEWSVRRAAAGALGEIGDGAAIAPLMHTAVEQQGSWQVYEAAYRSLGKLGTDQVIEFLLSIFNDPTHNHRRFAAKGLGESRDKRATESLLAVLEDASAEDDQPDAAEALGKIGDPRGVEPLITALRNERAWGLPEAAAKALGAIGDERAVRYLNRALLFGYRQLSEQAATALAKIRGERAVEYLISALAPRNTRLWVRTEAAHALGLSNSEKAVDPLIALLNDPDGEMRLEAVRSLGRLGDARAVPMLIERLSDTWVDEEAGAFGEGRICDVAAAALERIGTPEAQKAVATWRQQANDNVDRHFFSVDLIGPWD